MGTSAPTAGIILVESIHMRMSLVYLPLKKAMAYAAGAASISPTRVDSTLVMTEFLAYSR